MPGCPGQQIGCLVAEYREDEAKYRHTNTRGEGPHANKPGAAFVLGIYENTSYVRT